MSKIGSPQNAGTLIDELCDNGTEVVQGSIAVIAAHQDDEVISMGGRFGMLRDVYFVHVTDGAPKNMHDARRYGFGTRGAYAYARQCELAAAMAVANIDPNRSIEMGIADQDASKNMLYLVNELIDVLLYLKPDYVLTHPYEGGHPDHDATAFAVHAALAMMTRNNLALPAMYEFASYYNDNGSMAALEFLPGQPSTAVQLSTAQKKLKETMISCFRTQREMLSYFPLEAERFRPAPRYAFLQPPHQGTLYYELFDWGINGDQWRQQARDAMSSLDLQGSI